MTTTKDSLKAICNYSEHTKSVGPALSISYISMAVESEKEKLEKKMKNRSLAIDTVLDEVSEDASEYEVVGIGLGSSEIPTIAPRIMIVQASARHIDEDRAYFEAISFLDQNTRGACHGPVSLDIAISSFGEHLSESENEMANARRIIAKIMMASNLIAVEGRIGPATAVIAGPDCWKWMELCQEHGLSMNMVVILEPKMEPDKVIVARGGRMDNPGLMCVSCTADSTYFIKETHDWERQYAWFRIK